MEPTLEPVIAAPVVRRKLPLWLFLARWGFAVFVIAGALLLPVFLMGIRLHVHPWTAWRGTEAPEVAGLSVRVDTGLDIPLRTILELGGTGILNSPRTQNVEATWSELEGGGTRVSLGSSSDPPDGWHLDVDFAQIDATVVHVSATAGVGSESVGELTGTVLVNTLDWNVPGEKRCVYALHASADDPVCLRGSFTIER